MTLKETTTNVAGMKDNLYTSKLSGVPLQSAVNSNNLLTPAAQEVKLSCMNCVFSLK